MKGCAGTCKCLRSHTHSHLSTPSTLSIARERKCIGGSFGAQQLHVSPVDTALAHV